MCKYELARRLFPETYSIYEIQAIGQMMGSGHTPTAKDQVVGFMVTRPYLVYRNGCLFARYTTLKEAALAATTGDKVIHCTTGQEMAV